MTPIEISTPERFSGAFSSAVFRELAREHPSVEAANRIRIVAECGDSEELTLGQAFDRAHRLLVRGYRNEYIFKNELVSRIVFGRHSPRTASALLELRMGRSWADVVVMNGTSTTYEIKTDLDQFARLRTQLSDYSSRSEYVNVVTSDKRARAAEQHLPNYVGIVALRRSGSLTVVRPAESNQDRLVADHMFSMLRVGEALEILGEAVNYTLDVPAGRAWKRVRELFADLPIGVAHEGTVGALRRRGRGAALLTNRTDFPTSLRALAYATPLSEAAQGRLLHRLSAPASHALIA